MRSIPVPDRPAGHRAPFRACRRPAPRHRLRPAAAHRAQRRAERLLELGKLGVDVVVALAAQPVRLAVGASTMRAASACAACTTSVWETSRACSAAPVGDEALVRARPAAASRSASAWAALGQLGVLPAALGDRALGLVPGLRHASARPRRGPRRPPLGLLAGLGDHLLGVRAARLTRVCSASCSASATISSRRSSTSWASSSSPGRASRTSSSSSRTSPRGTTQFAVIGRPRASSTTRDQRVERLEDPVHERHPRTAHRPDGGLPTPACPVPAVARAGQARSRIRSSMRRCTGAGSRCATSPP